MPINSEYIQKIKSFFETKPVLRVYVFGSYANGSETGQSDIDILVDLDYSQKIGLRFVQMKLDLEKLLNKEVDLVSSNGLSPFIKSQIEKEKMLVYER